MAVVRRGEAVQAVEADVDRVDAVAVLGVDLKDLDASASATQRRLSIVSATPTGLPPTASVRSTLVTCSSTTETVPAPALAT